MLGHLLPANVSLCFYGNTSRFTSFSFPVVLAALPGPNLPRNRSEEMLAQGSRPNRTQRVLSMHQHSADISPQRLLGLRWVLPLGWVLTCSSSMGSHFSIWQQGKSQFHSYLLFNSSQKLKVLQTFPGDRMEPFYLFIFGH